MRFFLVLIRVLSVRGYCKFANIKPARTRQKHDLRDEMCTNGVGQALLFQHSVGSKHVASRFLSHTPVGLMRRARRGVLPLVMNYANPNVFSLCQSESCHLGSARSLRWNTPKVRYGVSDSSVSSNSRCDGTGATWIVIEINGVTLLSGPSRQHISHTLRTQRNHHAPSSVVERQ